MKTAYYISGLIIIAAAVLARFHLTSMNTARVMAMTKAISEVGPACGRLFDANAGDNTINRRQKLREIEKEINKRRAEIISKYDRRQADLRRDSNKRQSEYLAEERAAQAKYKAEYKNTNARLSDRDESIRKQDVSKRYNEDMQRMHKDHSYVGRDLQYAIDNLNRQKNQELQALKKLEDKWRKEVIDGAESTIEQSDVQSTPLNVITGIVSIGEGSSIFINGKVVHINEFVGDVKVVGITKDYAQFEKNGQIWTQSVGQTANSAWR